MEVRKIVTIGNSIGVTLPVDSLRFLGLKAGDNVKIFQEADCLRIMPVEVINKAEDLKMNKKEKGVKA